VYSTEAGGTDYTFNGGFLRADSSNHDFAYTGSEVKPFDGEDVYVKIETSVTGTPATTDSGVYVKATNVEYSNNTEVGTATAKIYFDDADYETKVDSKDVAVSATSGSYIVVNFKIAKASLNDVYIKAQATTTYTGGEVTLNKSDLALYLQDEDGNEVKVDESLYKISDITKNDGSTSVVKSGTKIKDENGTVTFNYTGAPSTDKEDENTLTVIYALTTEGAKHYAFSDDGNKIAGAIYVKKASWSDVVITAEDTTDGSTANVTVTLNGNTLTSTQYTATATPKNGLSYVTVNGVATYFDDLNDETFYVNIGKAINTKIQSVTLKDTKATYTYTGEEIKPEVTVKLYSSATLTEGVDYEIVYENNVDAGNGTAKYYVKGIGDYAGTKQGGTFTIQQAKLSSTTVTAEDVTYETTKPTVADLAKALTIKNGDTTLVYGTDFTVSLNGSVKDGENTLRIIPAEDSINYTGSTTATVKVTKVENLSAAEIATIANVAYTGEAQTPALKVTLGDKTLVQDTDYTVEYTNNTEVGKATATITGIGAYTGTNERNFVVVPQKVTGLKAVKKTATTLKLQFNAVEGADGYKIYDAETGKAIASVSTQNGADVLKKTITGLNAGETRKYKVRAYKIVNGTKRYAEYSAVYTKATAKK
jgi:hypothetical protein